MPLKLRSIQAIWNVTKIDQTNVVIDPSGLAQDVDATIVVECELLAGWLENDDYLLMVPRS